MAVTSMMNTDSLPHWKKRKSCLKSLLLKTRTDYCNRTLIFLNQIMVLFLSWELKWEWVSTET